MTARERLRMHLVQALTRSNSQNVRDHIRAALHEWEDLPPTPLLACPICGRVGLPERITNHDCRNGRKGLCACFVYRCQSLVGYDFRY